MRVFVDTNVLVSGFATRGLCADVIRLILAEYDLVISEKVIAEFRRVLIKKFKVPLPRVDDAEALLRRYHVEPDSDSKQNVEIRDPDDAFILGSALAASAEVLVTGDRDLLVLTSEVSDIRILSPREFWQLVRAG